MGNICGFFIDQDPSPILVIQPTIELAETWSKDRLAPMLRDTPALKTKVHEAKSRDSDNTLRQKIFPGGRLSIVGANAPTGLAARPIRVVMADEVDRYPVSAGSEGDPLKLGQKRQQTFWNRKTVIGSTPVIKETSVIEREWKRSDQRHYHVPCPACSSTQPLVWSNVRWDKDEHGRHLEHTAHYVCAHCGALWNDIERWDAIRRGRWVAANPHTAIAGFHIPQWLSPWVTLREIVHEFLAAFKHTRDPGLMQIWTNTVAGEVWEEASETVEGAPLFSRCENYGYHDLPDGVRMLSAGVDVQSNRLEVQIVGWGAYEETWVARVEALHGDPAQPHLWQQLDALLLEKYVTARGRVLRIAAACVDTGGHHGSQVFEYCRPRRARRIYPIKGVAGPRLVWPKRPSRTHSKRDEVFLLGVDTAKDTIYGRLKIPTPGPGYVHFPIEVGAEYFAQLTSERVVTRKKEGRPYRVWVLPNNATNEALDTFVYALAARLSIPIRLDKFAEQPLPEPPPPVEEDTETAPERSRRETETPVTPPTPTPVPPVTRAWFGERKGWFDK
jgi:phage terminase large subunit GpA-like protein